VRGAGYGASCAVFAAEVGGVGTDACEDRKGVWALVAGCGEGFGVVAEASELVGTCVERTMIDSCWRGRIEDDIVTRDFSF
jgi:hypothetical protein